jgi:hypothetical protein
MRRPLVALGATAIVAAVAAAPASADTFKGSCNVTGKATFGQPLKGTKAPNTYDFRSGPPADGRADETRCTGQLNGQSVTNKPAFATVAGAGNLSCAQSESTTDGSGYLQFPDTGSVFPFGFSFTGVLTEVDFKVKYGGQEASGHASFAEFAPPDAAIKCETTGIPELGFRASFDGGDKVFPGYNTANLNPGPGSSGAPGPSTAPQRTTTTPKPSPCARLKGKKRTACVRRQACLKKKGKRRSRCLSALNKAKKNRPARRRR